MRWEKVHKKLIELFYRKSCDIEAIVDNENLHELYRWVGARNLQMVDWRV